MAYKGFWSYARGDDDHLNKQLSDLQRRVSGEISMQLGQDVDMFQDIYDLRTGDDWAATLRGNLTQATFLIPVLTPRYFERPWCREEILTFLRLAEEAGVTPMIFPIYFINDRKGERGETCEVREAIGRFQYFDFRKLRFEEVEKRLWKGIHDFAEDVVTKLEVGAPIASVVPAPPVAPAEPTPPPVETTGFQEAKPKFEPKTHVVDPWPGAGDFHTIGAAMEAAQAGERILIRPGTYIEQLELDKPLELVGDGAPAEVIVQTSSGIALHCTAHVARIRNLTFLRLTGDGKNSAAWVAKGQPEFENCVFSSQSLSAVEVLGTEAAPVFRRCTMRDSSQSGMFFREGATGHVEDCDLTANGFHGVGVATAASPRFRNCRLSGNKQSGAFIYKAGKGVFENCEIVQNGKNGVAVREEGNPTVRGCTIASNGREGVWAEDATGAGTFIDNIFRDNGGKGAWDLAEGSEQNITRRNNREE